MGKWLKDPRWAAAGFSVRGPWGAAEIRRQRAWRAEQLQEDRSAEGGAAGGLEGLAGKLRDLATAKQIAVIKVLVEREANLKVDRMIKEKEYVRRDEADEAGAAKWRAVRTALMALPRALRQRLGDSGDAAKAEAILEGALRAVCMDGF